MTATTTGERVRTLSVGTAAALLVVLLGACGGGDPGTTEAARSEPSAPSLADEAETSTTTTSTTSTSTTTEPPTTTTSPEQLRATQLAEDLPLIKALWRRGSDAWDRGRDAGLTFVGDNNHPEYTQGVRDASGCRRNGSSIPEDTKIEHVLDDQSVERDDGWMPSEMNRPPEGRIYIMKVSTSINYAPAEAEEVHAAVLDGRAYWFFGCKAP